MSNTCWCLVNEFKNSLHRRWQIWSLMQFHVNLKQILYKYINNFTAIVFVHRTIIQYLLTAEIDTFICLFIYCTFLLAMAVPVHKIFTMFVTKVYACFYVFVCYFDVFKYWFILSGHYFLIWISVLSFSVIPSLFISEILCVFCQNCTVCQS